MVALTRSRRNDSLIAAVFHQENRRVVLRRVIARYYRRKWLTPLSIAWSIERIQLSRRGNRGRGRGEESAMFHELASRLTPGCFWHSSERGRGWNRVKNPRGGFESRRWRKSPRKPVWWLFRAFLGIINASAELCDGINSCGGQIAALVIAFQFAKRD